MGITRGWGVGDYRVLKVPYLQLEDKLSPRDLIHNAVIIDNKIVL